MQKYSIKPKIINVCVVIIINLLVLTIYFEILSRAFLFDYMDSKLSKVVRSYQFDEDIKWHSNFPFNDQTKIPHPYLGYVRPNVNENFDIINEKTQEDKDPIAIFGGSVAENFYRFNKKEKLLQKGLKETFGLKNDFGIKNYALGGYKQPQQLFASILFRPKVRVTINIEGYNEFDMVLQSHFPYYYPMKSVSKLYYSGMENWEFYIRAGKVKDYQRKLKFLIEKDWWLKFIPTVFKILYFMKESHIIDLEKKLY